MIFFQIWENRPSQPATELITVHPKVSGKTSVEKIIELQVLMTAKKVKWLVLTALDEVACKCFLHFVSRIVLLFCYVDITGIYRDIINLFE